MMVNFKSAMKGNTDLALGNILGSNVFNIVMIGGLLSVAGGWGSLAGAPISEAFNARAGLGGFVNTLAFGASALLLTAALKFNKAGIGKKQGGIALGLYAAYTAATLYLGQGAPAATAAAAPVPAALPAPGP
jgi:Ca2+/Na+ antiporter